MTSRTLNRNLNRSKLNNMKSFLSPLFIVLLTIVGCDSPQGDVSFRVDCPDPSTTSTTDPTDPTDPTGEPPPPPPPPVTSIPGSTAPCPDLSTSGVKNFCPDALDACRQVTVFNAENASGTGPAVLWWHGTGQTAATVLNGVANGSGGQLRAMVTRSNGILFVPTADPAALARANNSFPWWVVCLQSGSECGRPDDFILADEVMSCAVEQETASPLRLNVGGFSAGGMMTSHLVDRVGYFAGAVSYSGGLPGSVPMINYQPTTPVGPTAVMALHGGPTDQYFGVGMPPNVGYPFQVQTENLAVDIDDANQATGRFAFVCNHRGGHTWTWMDPGALFLEQAVQGQPHLLETYGFGYPGNGTSWFLNNRCYRAGAPAQ